MSDRLKDEQFMSLAIAEATDAMHHHDVPVGAVLVDDTTGEILARAHNQREVTHNVLDHAEMRVIDEACRKRGDWRLNACTLYVTLEPCPMCAGALINSRVERVVFGLRDAKAGCLGSVLNMNRYPFNHAFEVTEGVLAEESAKLLSKFFAKKRTK